MTQPHTQTLNFGPQHPATHGIVRLILELEGEVIKRIDPHIGFLHRGKEKLIESKTYLQALPHFDRMDYLSPITCEHAYTLAIEKLLGVTPPLRAQYIRVLLSELSRIMSHLINIATITMDLGAITPFLWLFEEREKLMGLFESVSGARMHLSYIRPGGVHRDLPLDFLERVSNFITRFPPRIDDIENLITENRIFKKRTIGIGVATHQDALDWGFSGPMLRASGIAWDLRRSQPYEIYEHLDFDIPVGHHGDCYDRYLVRIAEMRQSLNILKQCVEHIPSGPTILEDYKIAPPPSSDIQTSMEALIHHFKLYSEGLTVPAGEVYACVESPKGEFGVFLVSDGSTRPYRCKVRTPSFAFMQSIDAIARNHMLSDLVAIIGSMDVVYGEIDR